MLIVNGVRYKPWTPKDEEKEFHPLIKAQSKEIFGKDSIYFDVKTTIKTASGIGLIPDAYVIDLAEPYEWYVIENELSTYPVYEHIVKQLTKFINGIDYQNSRTQILELLYEEINRDSTVRAAILAKTKSVDVYHFLSKLFSKTPKIVVIIDEKTPDVEEACQALRYSPEIIEFKTFVREDNPNTFAHLFEPLHITDEEPAKEKQELKVEEKRVLPKQYDNWESMLNWSDDKVKEMVQSLTTMSSVDFPNFIHKSVGRYYCFYRGKVGTKARFVGLILHKNDISVRIRADAATLSDPQKVINPKTYSAWFFGNGKGQEREFKLSDKEQIQYDLKLIKQSYELAK